MEEISMSTFMAKAETIERKWYILDAAGKPLGKTAAAAATMTTANGAVQWTPSMMKITIGGPAILTTLMSPVLTTTSLKESFIQFAPLKTPALSSIPLKQNTAVRTAMSAMAAANISVRPVSIKKFGVWRNNSDYKGVWIWKWY